MCVCVESAGLAVVAPFERPTIARRMRRLRPVPARSAHSHTGGDQARVSVSQDERTEQNESGAENREINIVLLEMKLQ